MKSWADLANESGGDTAWARRMDGLQKNGDESLGIAKPTRASAVGQVDAAMTYDEWLKGKEGSKIDSGLLFAPKSDSDVWTNERLSSEGNIYKGKPIMPEAVDEKSFKEWFDNPQENFIIDNLPSHIKEALETNADSLIFSQETLIKQKTNHPEITVKDYTKVLNKIIGCKEIYERGERHIGLVVEAEDFYRLILKTTNDYAEAYITSLHKINKDSLKAFRRSKRIQN